MASSPLERTLHFVVGKGGVGKTTVSAALALNLARAGCRTLAIEMETGGRLAAVLGVVEATTARPVRVERRLHTLAIDGRHALEEYLGMLIPVKRLLSTVFQSRIYQYFVAAAPGLKELMTIGKIWYEVTREEGGKRVWDAVVVDAPATGHSLQYLRMPQAARDTFGAGLVQREASRVVDLLQDPRTTAVHIVTLAEEMPVAEALETYTQLNAQLKLPVGWVVANRVRHRQFAEATVHALRAAAARRDGERGELLDAVAARGEEENGWAAINAQNLARLRAGVGSTAVVELPNSSTK
jgi:anion-transporting  ArsA/GET3 family ATPase